MPKVSVGRAELDTRPHFLYRFYDRSGVLLYIGITVNFEEREKQHAASKEWWALVDRNATRVEYHLGRRAVLDAERLAIRAERPLENDQHNEFVEADVRDEINEPWSVDDFAREVLDNATEIERDIVLSDNEHDFCGNERTIRGRDIAAAFSLLMNVTWDRSNLHTGFDLLRSMLELAGDGQWMHYMPTEEPNDSEVVSEYDSDQAFMRAFIASKAGAYLSRLSEDEADQWRDCALALEGFSTDKTEIEIVAAMYANAFKTKRRTRKGICSGPHHSGARCSRLDLVETVYEICPICEDVTACAGHRIWCEKHDGMARTGRLEMYEDSRLARAPIRPDIASGVAA